VRTWFIYPQPARALQSKHDVWFVAEPGIARGEGKTEILLFTLSPPTSQHLPLLPIIWEELKRWTVLPIHTVFDSLSIDGGLVADVVLLCIKRLLLQNYRRQR
jgi:hypothetical protein